MIISLDVTVVVLKTAIVVVLKKKTPHLIEILYCIINY